MSSLFEWSVRRHATSDPHDGETCRGRRGAPCIAVGVLMAALVTTAPFGVLAGNADGPSAISRAPAATVSLFVVPMIEVEPPEQTKLFWFAVTGGEDTPPGTHVLVKGLSAGVLLSSGQANADGAWVVPLSELEELKIRVPPSFSGRLNLDVALVDGNGAVLDEHPAELRVKPARVAGASIISAADTIPPEQAVLTTRAAAPPPAEPEPLTAPSVDVKSAPAEPAGVAATNQPKADVEPQQAAAAVTTVPPPRPHAPELRIAPVLEEAAIAAPGLAQAARLAEQGDRAFARGNIAEARQYFTRAFDLGLAIAALKNAETYDPKELDRPGVFGVKPNPAEARRWYQRAVELNVPGAVTRVQRLGAR
jgi:hypothetical protein